MRILITGGTGFIGKALVKHLSSKGHSLILLTRNKSLHQSTAQTNYVADLNEVPSPSSLDGVINLAGEPLNAKRWNAKFKTQLLESRPQITKTLVDWVKQHDLHLKVWINGSAIGWYGPQDADISLTESANTIDCFSHDLCARWEAEARKAKTHCSRLAILRIGIVLEEDGGPLASMLPAFKLGMGGRLGSGEQVWSWIHRHDLVRLIEACLENPQLTGAINACAPEALSQAEFAKQLAEALNRPCIAPMPAWMAKLMLGEFAEEVLLQGQRVFPKAAIDAGFDFDYPCLDQALAACFNHKLQKPQESPI